MKVYMVGGAVRDRLLGLPVQDHDWVVVGATPEAMLAAGYLPVGKDFPVFLHPQTHEEYALARTERKTARGYHGFSFRTAPDVTLEQDLQRRDLTINAMAQAEDGQLIDPYGGLHDLQARELRHVSDAFVEDPVRILRLARFAARFADFSVAAETQVLMQRMVQEGEVDALVPERVWQELARGLMEARPSRMFEVLRSCGALARILPEVDRLWGVPHRAGYHPEVDTGMHVMMVLEMSAHLQASLPVRFSCLTQHLGKGATPAELLPHHPGHEARSAELLRQLCQRLRVPNECRELAELVAREHSHLHDSGELGPADIVCLLERCDALRKPQRFADALLACECDARGHVDMEHEPYPQRPRLLAALEAARAVPTAPIAAAAAARGLHGPQIAEAIHQARIEAVAAVHPH
ncbi:multifunctional CCA addition/repair protein [Eleftheria terrae]|uniref:multifunctional CCA addition/repair protein n=1 Tax=Eleftheria terrae TaxID=1597781 RepID=UPI00263A5C3F|nr:multifunctional CCA addition/repair protein [Eleftheria terrae]WKB50658.1 multifunctional CCA addition/repair protein [Eleftheria terrae]